MKKDKFQKHAERIIELDKMEGFKNRPSNTMDLYKEYWDSCEKNFDTKEFFKNEHGILSPHDKHYEDFSERRDGNVYLTKFRIDSIVYKDRQEIGYLPCLFTIKTEEKFRDISGRRIFEFLIDTKEKKIVTVFPKKTGWNYEYRVLGYKEIDLVFGNFYSW